MRALTLLCLAFVFAVSSDLMHADTLIGSGVTLLSVTQDIHFGRLGEKELNELSSLEASRRSIQTCFFQSEKIAAPLFVPAPLF